LDARQVLHNISLHIAEFKKIGHLGVWLALLYLVSIYWCAFTHLAYLKWWITFCMIFWHISCPSLIAFCVLYPKRWWWDTYVDQADSILTFVSDSCFTFPVSATSVNVHRSYSLYCKSHYMFRPNWSNIRCTSCVLKGTAILPFCSNCCGLFKLATCCSHVWYQECSLLGCGTMWVYCKLTFRKNVSHSSSG
jgi:hypothetical protein